MKLFYQFILIISLLLGFVSCAIVSAPTGGSKDEKGPLVKTANPESGVTQFDKTKPILLEFDEKIKIENPAQEVLITPLCKPAPKFKALKNKLSIDFSEVNLAENTTYSISFGKSIKDNNEGNLMGTELRYVFSTGKEIDTLSVKGKLIDAFTLESMNDYKVGLYPETTTDSSLFITPPSYYTTIKNGQFEIGYLSEKPFKIFCFEDKNNNQVWDNDESFGFLKTTIIPYTSDSLLLIKINKVSEKSDTKLKFNIQYPYFSVSLKSGLQFATDMDKNQSVSYEVSRETDSIFGLLTPLSSDTKIRFSLNTGLNQKIDTILLIKPQTPKNKWTKNFSSNQEYYLKAGGLYGLVSNYPFELLNPKNIHIILNGKPTKDFTFQYFNAQRNQLIWNVSGIEEGDSLAIKIFPNALQNYFGEKNKDTLIWKAQYPAMNNFGLISELQINNPNNRDLIVYLLNDKGVVSKQFTVSSLDKTYSFTKIFLESGTYSIKLLWDKNVNGKFDNGNLFNKIEPEPVKLFPEKIIIKGNWEVAKLEYDWSE